MYKKYLEEVYDEAIKAVYPETEERTKCIEEIVPLIRQGLKVLDFCCGEGELKGFCPWIEEFKGGEEMHSWISKQLSDSYNQIIVRHVLEHSIMPFILLKEFKRVLKRRGELIVIIPEHTKEMINYLNHYSVLTKLGWERLFTKAGFTHEYLGSAVFNRLGYVEHRYICRKVI